MRDPGIINHVTSESPGEAPGSGALRDQHSPDGELDTESPTKPLRLVVVSGMSGAGRSTAAHSLEDLGWYVVDNLPPSVLPEVCRQAREIDLTRLAVVLDVRTRGFFEQLPSMFTELAAIGTMPEILFLEAADDVIVRRQESVRRPHPLQGDGRLLDGIGRERETLATLRAAADLVIDTSSLNIHQLTSRVAHAYGGSNDDQLRVTLLSFGFKYGVPVDADMIFDVRFLPNPHWIPELRPQTGLSKPVSDYVLGQPGAEPFIASMQDLMAVVSVGYINEGKRFATVANIEARPWLRSSLGDSVARACRPLFSIATWAESEPSRSGAHIHVELSGPDTSRCGCLRWRAWTCGLSDCSAAGDGPSDGDRHRCGRRRLLRSTAPGAGLLASGRSSDGTRGVVRR